MHRIFDRAQPGLACAALALTAATFACAGGDPPPEEKRVHMMAELPRIELPAEAVTMPMLSYGNRPLVELLINGRGPYRFILDTGAGSTVVDAALAAELKLPEIGKQQIGSPAGGEPMTVSRVAMKDVSIGAIRVHDLEAATMNLAGYFGAPESPRGVLSALMFSGALLTVDYPGQAITIRNGALGPADGARIFQYQEEDGHPTVTLSVAGTEIRAHIDTGSPSTFTLPGRYMKTLPLESEPVRRGEARLVDTTVELFIATLDGSVRLGEYTFERPGITFGDRFPAGNVGYGLLGGFALTLDAKNHRVKLDRAGGPTLKPAPVAGADGPVRIVREAPGGAQPKRYGVGFQGIAENPLEVMNVDSGSPAEQAGLLAGDRIVEMNGKPVAKLDSGERIGLLRSSPLTLVIDRGGKKMELRMTL